MAIVVRATALPSDTPEFFRLADEELSYVCNDPDRWRVMGNAPTLRALDFPNHWFALERHPDRLPKTRYEFLTGLALAGKLTPGNTVLDFGTAPYAISEYAEMLTETFRHWQGASCRASRFIEGSVEWLACS